MAEQPPIANVSVPPVDAPIPDAPKKHGRKKKSTEPIKATV